MADAGDAYSVRHLDDQKFHYHNVHCPIASVLVYEAERCIKPAAGAKDWIGARGVSVQLGGRSNTIFQYHVKIISGLCRIGWGVAGGSLLVGTDEHSWGYGGTSKKSHAKRYEDWGEVFGAGDVISATLDLRPNVKISFSKNGRDLGVAYSGISEKLRSEQWYPCVALKEGAALMFVTNAEAKKLVAAQVPPPDVIAPVAAVGNRRHKPAPAAPAPPAGCGLFHLPRDMLYSIALMLPLHLLGRLLRTCQYSNQLFSDEAFWRLRITQDYPVYKDKGPPEGWKKLYSHLWECLLNPYVHEGSLSYARNTDIDVVGDGSVHIMNGFVDGVLVNGVPLGSNYPDCAGSIGRFFTGYNNRDQLQPYIDKLGWKLNEGIFNFYDPQSELQPLLNRLVSGHYHVHRALISTTDIDHLTYRVANQPMSGYWDMPGGFVQETQPESSMNHQRVEFYRNRIKEILDDAKLPADPQAPPPKNQGKKAPKAKSGPEPRPLVTAMRSKLRKALPIVLIARTENIDYILDGHHKFRAYEELGHHAVALVIEPAFDAKKDDMMRLIPNDTTGHGIVQRFA